jgi:hypothetical protein
LAVAEQLAIDRVKAILAQKLPTCSMHCSASCQQTVFLAFQQTW